MTQKKKCRLNDALKQTAVQFVADQSCETVADSAADVSTGGNGGPPSQVPIAVSIPQLQHHLADVAQATRAVAVALTRMLLAGTGTDKQNVYMHAMPQPPVATAQAAEVTRAVEKLLEGSKPLMCMWETRDVDVAAGAHRNVMECSNYIYVCYMC